MASNAAGSSNWTVLLPVVGAAAIVGAFVTFGPRWSSTASKFSIGDQEKRYHLAQKTNNQRVLNVDKFFDPSLLKGKRVLVVGASRGLGFEVVTRLKESGAFTIGTVRRPNPDLQALGIDEIIEGVEVTADKGMEALVKGLKGQPVDICIALAGYFYGPVEKLSKNSLNFQEELKMIDICALGPLRVANALYQNNLLQGGGKFAIITSQAGSIQWREEQNPDGDNYGHHMSRAATNIMGRLLSFEMKEKNISVALLHPGFNKTSMTEKYKDIWEKEGAVDPAVGAKRVLHEINRMSLENTGRFINCEDGLLIPW